MAKQLTTRYLTRQDQTDLLTFIELAYGANYILADEAFFEWYTHPPRLSREESRLPIIGALWGEKLVGHMFIIPHYFSDKKEKVPMVWNSNFMVHPDFQQKGIGPEIVRRILSDPDISVSAGTGASLQQKGGRSLLTAMGYNFSFMRKYVFLFRQEALPLLIEQKPEDGTIVKEKYNLFKTYLPKDGFTVVSINTFDDRFTEFWRAFGARRFFGTWRDADFLNWRYFAHPYFTYRVRAVLDKGKTIRGFGVYRLEIVTGSEKPATVARMADFLAEEGYREELLSAMLKEMENGGALWVDFFTTARIFDDAFTSLGFMLESDLAARIPRLLQPLSHEDSAVNLVAKMIRDDASNSGFNDFTNWYSTSADGDQDRPNAARHE